MAKTKSNRRRGGAKQGGNWSNADHEARTAKRVESLNKKRRRREEEEQQQQEREAREADGREEPPSHAPQKPQQQPPHHEPPRHQLRPTKRPSKRPRLASHVPDNTYKRSHLAHDNYDQIDSTKLRLATSQLQRKVDALRARLEAWDPVAEAKVAALQAQEGYEDKTSIDYKMKVDALNREEDRSARRQAASEYGILYAKHGVNSSKHRRKANLKKKPRPGPESWKLRGAARPAWEVYDFDTRYVDVHAKAHEEANERARRSKNVLALCRGRFALDGDDEDEDDNNQSSNGDGKQRPFPPPQPHCREFLSLLTQLGSLHLERKNYASARKSFLEAISLEGPKWANSITNARAQLMNMYLSTNRPSSARKLWTMLDADGSAWIRYSAALIEYVSWNLLHEEGSTADSAERLLARAIKGNVYVAYFLGWPHMFEKAMEYTDEVVERGMDSKGGSMLEAIEYGCRAYAGEDDGEEEERGISIWLGTEGSLDWVRSVVLKVLTQINNETNEDDRLTKADLLSWETKLRAEEEDFERERNEKEQRLDDDQQHDEDVDEEEKEDEPDVVMYAGMFRTAMDWLEDAGEFLKAPSFDYINENGAEEDGAEENDIAKDGGEGLAEQNDSNDNDGDDGSAADSSDGSEDDSSNAD